MAYLWRSPVMLLAAAILLGSQLLVCFAQTEEQKLRTALSNPAISSFQLISNIKLTQTLPAIELTEGVTRNFRLFSTRGFSINGAKKFRGLWTKENASTGKLVLTVDNVKLSDFRAKNPLGLDPVTTLSGFGVYGAAIRVTGSVKILNSVLTRNVAERDGGAVYVLDGSLQLINSNFTDNLSRSQGGAVTHRPDGVFTLTVEGCTFIGNTVTGFLARGGAIYHDDFNGPSSITMTRSLFKSNTALDGGAFYAVQTTTPVTFNSCSFDSNLAKGTDAHGGALFLNNVNQIRFTGTTIFTNNLVNAIPNNIFVFRRPQEDPPTKIVGLTRAQAALVLGLEPGSFIIA